MSNTSHQQTNLIEWNNLPRHILKQICTYLPNCIIYQTCFTCKMWHSILIPVLWHTYPRQLTNDPNAKHLLKKYGYLVRQLDVDEIDQTGLTAVQLANMCPNVEDIRLTRDILNGKLTYIWLLLNWPQLHTMVLVKPLSKRPEQFHHITPCLRKKQFRKIHFNYLDFSDNLINQMTNRDLVEDIQIQSLNELQLKLSVESIQLFYNLRVIKIKFNTISMISINVIHGLVEKVKELNFLRIFELEGLIINKGCISNDVSLMQLNYSNILNKSNIHSISFAINLISHYMPNESNTNHESRYITGNILNFQSLFNATYSNLLHLKLSIIDANILIKIVIHCPHLMQLYLQCPLPYAATTLSFNHLRRLSFASLDIEMIHQNDYMRQLFPKLDSVMIDNSIYDFTYPNITDLEVIAQLFPNIPCVSLRGGFLNMISEDLIHSSTNLNWRELIISDEPRNINPNFINMLKKMKNLNTLVVMEKGRWSREELEKMLEAKKVNHELNIFLSGNHINNLPPFEFGELKVLE